MLAPIARVFCWVGQHRQRDWPLLLALMCVCACNSPLPLVPVGPALTPTPDPICRTPDGKRAVDVLDQYIREWNDAETLAKNTSRVALAGPVGQLQRIRRDVEAIQWPACASVARSLFTAGMNDEIDGLVTFMGFDENKPDPRLGASYRITVGTVGETRANAIFADQMGRTKLASADATFIEFNAALARLASAS